MQENKYIVQIKNVCKSFGQVEVIKDLNLNIKQGEFVTLLGPSGCGKTTTLRMIAGFETPTSGEILLGGEKIEKVPPNKRPLNTVFQKYALFPHLNVFKNVSFGLNLKREEVEIVKPNGKKIVKKKKLDKKFIEDEVNKALKLVGMKGYEKRDVNSLSGGQQQRVAIARAIVNKPQLLLLDEPLGALDLKMRKEMQEELKEMHQKLGITFIYVTHDQEEALTMSDTIVVMNEGVIYQEGTPMDIYNEPTSMFVADFIGDSNIFYGKMHKDNKIEFIGNIFQSVDEDFEIGENVDVVIRPEDMEIVSKSKAQFEAKVIDCSFKGVHYDITLETNNYTFNAQTTKSSLVGDTVGVKIQPENIQVMKKTFNGNDIEVEFKSNSQLYIEDSLYEYDPSVLFKDYRYEKENDELFDKKNNLIEIKGRKGLVNVSFEDLDLSDHEEDAPLAGNVVNMVYLGDEYQVTVLSDNNITYRCTSDYLWDKLDRVGILIEKDKFSLVKLYEQN